jgi:hypothetical protein
MHFKGLRLFRQSQQVSTKVFQWAGKRRFDGAQLFFARPLEALVPFAPVTIWHTINIVLEHSYLYGRAEIRQCKAG